MNKLLSVIVAALFAVSTTAFVASPVGAQMKDEKKSEKAKTEKAKTDKSKAKTEKAKTDKSKAKTDKSKAAAKTDAKKKDEMKK
jgi:hypothetical protein